MTFTLGKIFYPHFLLTLLLYKFGINLRLNTNFWWDITCNILWSWSWTWPKVTVKGPYNNTNLTVCQTLIYIFLRLFKTLFFDCSFGRMRTANCSKRGLTALPKGFPSDIMDLDLSWNSLTVGELHTVCQLKSLRILSVSHNKLTNLSTSLSQCSSVLELNLTGFILIILKEKIF